MAHIAVGFEDGDETKQGFYINEQKEKVRNFSISLCLFLFNSNFPHR